MEGVWITKEVISTYGVSLWKTISNLWSKFSLKTSFKVGNGMKIAFWEDDWLGRGSLKTLYPDIYSINQQQETTVGEVWTLTFKRRLFDWGRETISEN